MLLISCPYCGPRDEIEFQCGGESHIQRPSDVEGTSDQAWGTYLFFRANPKGVHRERWHHTFGCRRWFNIARSTVTHEILAVYPMGVEAPATLGAAPTVGGAS
jgi:sarcosine oxidase subunit delta